MAEDKIAVTPMCQLWSYHSLALSHQYNPIARTSLFTIQSTLRPSSYYNTQQRTPPSFIFLALHVVKPPIGAFATQRHSTADKLLRILSSWELNTNQSYFKFYRSNMPTFFLVELFDGTLGQ